MTSTPEKQPTSLKAVPPNQIKSSAQSAPKSPEMPAQESMPVPEKPGINWGRIVFLCAVVGGGFWLSQLEVNTVVRGKGKFAPLPGNRHSVYLEEPGRIVNFMVKNEDKVKPGTILAEVQNEDLKDEIVDEKLKLQEEQSKLTSARERILILMAQKSEAEQRVRAIERQVQEAEDDVNRLSSSSPPPEIQSITHEIAAMDRQIAGLEKAIYHRDRRMEGLQKQIDDAEDAIAVRALSRNYQTDLEERIQMLQEESAMNDARISELIAHQLSKQAEIASIGQNLERQLENIQDELRMEEDRLATVIQELESAEQEKLAQEAIVRMRQETIESMQAQQDKNKTLKAEHEGTIFAENLSENKGKWLERHEQILEIVNIDRLEARILVDQADADLLQPLNHAESAEVKLKRMQPGYKPQTVELSDIKTVAQPDPSQTTKQLVLTATVENFEQRELVNGEFYADIPVGTMPLYERVRREGIKVLKLRQYF
ncbi:HlyD family efflux transporter periplasmic adaptor subunit [Roseofilum sp. BLCC_M91]|uniref:HlyD family efflux transporter periplasmic adaptor subunit n=1 Tax=Roseofilum halophilum BLCC-M91 TaxID=3022259 RepID=A0ABT7BLI7_9CYAN|nr:HlyD family efflux transporter periplasmic adaptor subunit [Roseofilum halophilum]MDJ1180060.1 HlyD family efflux transporter periplasmic adaptor subunit [Roseofilum halophilum BLCC-M91]